MLVYEEGNFLLEAKASWQAVIAAFSVLPVILLYMGLAVFFPAFYLDRMLYPDSFEYLSISDRYPFCYRFLLPFIVSFFPAEHAVNMYFVINSTSLVCMTLILYKLLQLYSNDRAYLGVLMHNLSFPVFMYFLPVLTDGVAYLLLVLLLYAIKVRASDLVITVLLFISLFIRETTVIIIPLWFYSSASKKDILLPVLSLLSLVFIIHVMFSPEQNGILYAFSLPTHDYLWRIVISVAVFIPFTKRILNSSIEDKIYLVTCCLLFVYAFLGAYIDPRFILPFYPLLIANCIRDRND